MRIFKAKIRELKNNIEKNELEALKKNLDKKWLAYYRDMQGKSPLHKAIEKKYFPMAMFLLDKYPLLSKLNDCVRASFLIHVLLKMIL